MSKPYESILVKARKLAAMAAPDNGASEQERETAAAALQQLLAKYKITESDLAEDKREWRELECVSRFRDQQPKLNKNLAMMARVCFAYIVGDISRPCKITKGDYEIPTRGFKVKFRQIHIVRAFCTEHEYRDWVDCFRHYAPDFIEMNEERAEALRQAKYDHQHAWSHFCGANDIVPPLPEPSKAPSFKEMLREIGASKVKRTTPWGTGKIAPSNLIK